MILKKSKRSPDQQAGKWLRGRGITVRPGIVTERRLQSERRCLFPLVLSQSVSKPPCVCLYYYVPWDFKGMHSWQTVRSPNRAGRGNSVNSRSSLQRAVIIVHLGIFGIDIVQRVTLSCKYDNCHRSGKTGKQQFVAWSYRVKWGTEYNSERWRYHIGLHAWVKWQMFKLKMHAVTTRCELVDLFTAWVVSYASWVDGWVSGGVLRSDEVKLWTFWHHQTVAMKQERTRTVENKPKIAKLCS